MAAREDPVSEKRFVGRFSGGTKDIITHAVNFIACALKSLQKSNIAKAI